MSKNFFFNYEEYDFWPLYDSIKKYYPIGIKKNQHFDVYRQYPGIQDLEKLIVERLEGKNPGYDSWKSFLKKLGDKIGKQAHGATFGYTPSYSAYMNLESKTKGNRWILKDLCFSVSHLGEFYQIYGIEKSVLSYVMEYEGEEVPYQIVNLKRIVISPNGEFKYYFEEIEKYISETYIQYRLVPFKIGQTIIDGLQIFHMDNEICSINMALFNDFLGLGEQVDEVEPEGDLLYGMENWRK